MKATWLKSAMGAASPAACWLAVVACVAVLAPSCGRRGSGVPAGMRIEGLTVSGPGPVLSWPAVAGAAEYGVTVVGEAGTKALWVWQGAATRVPYGVADVGGLGEDSSFMPAMRPWHVRSLQPGGHYRWLVVALDARGRTVAVSEIQHFTAPGAAPRPSAPAAAEPTRPAASPTAGAPGWTSKLLSTLAGRSHPVAARHACDALSREQLRSLLRQDPGEPARNGARCEYGKLLTVETGPASKYAREEKLFRELEELPVQGVGTKAFYLEFYVGVQLHVRDRRYYAYVNLEDKTEQRLEHAKAIAAALLAGAGADTPR